MVRLTDRPDMTLDVYHGRKTTKIFCLDSLVISDVACCYLWLFSLYINIKIGENSC